MDRDERLQRMREQYRLRRDRETPEEAKAEDVETESICDIEGTSCTS